MRHLLSVLFASLALPAMAEVPQVVADLPPVHSLVAQVMGELGEPALLLDKGANGHSFQLRPSQAASLAEADLVVWIGPEMTPWLDRALKGLSTAPALALLDAPDTHIQDFGAEQGLAEAGHDEEGHEHTGHDPHAWLDPDNAKAWLPLIAAELAKLDPENAATYAANARLAAERIGVLDAEMTALLAPVKDRPIVVFHQAYGYFASHYGLTVAAAIAEGDAAAPGAQHLAQVQSVLSQSPTCLFPEANHDPKLAEQLADATGAKLGMPLDPEGSTLVPGPGLYADLMRELGKSLGDCLRD